MESIGVASYWQTAVDLSTMFCASAEGDDDDDDDDGCEDEVVKDLFVELFVVGLGHDGEIGRYGSILDDLLHEGVGLRVDVGNRKRLL
jgi:hypothetical protein